MAQPAAAGRAGGGVPGAPPLPPRGHALPILERPLPRSRADAPTVSLSAYAYLLSELVQYALDRSSSTAELEERCARRLFVVCAPVVVSLFVAFFSVLLLLCVCAPPRSACRTLRLWCARERERDGRRRRAAPAPHTAHC